VDAPLETRNLEVDQSGSVSTHALATAMGRVPIWLFTWLVLFLLSLTVALPWYKWFQGVVGNNYEPGAISAFLDNTFRWDNRGGLDTMNRATAQSGAMIAFLSILFGVFFAGGWLQVFLERTRGQSLRRFFFGGARYFWRFLRVLILTLLILAVFGWLVYDPPFQETVLGSWLGVPAKDHSELESLDSEGTFFAIRAGQSAVFALLFALTLTWADYTRTRLALQDTHSAIWSGLQTFFTMLRHPIRTLRPMLILLLAEALVVFAFAWGVQWLEQGFLSVDGEIPTAGPMRVWVIGILSQFALMWRAIIRGARYHATARVSHEIVRPLSRPDPWRESIGGPGGPRYPLEEGDEYGVAL